MANSQLTIPNEITFQIVLFAFFALLALSASADQHIYRDL
jgi:hypothetical protein